MALDFAESRSGESIVYVLWVEEPHIQFVYFGDIAPAYRLKKSYVPIGSMIFKEGKLQARTW